MNHRERAAAAPARRVLFCACLLMLAATAAWAQSGEMSAASCTFEDGKELTVRYHPVPSKGELPKKAVWQPGGSPLLLFSEASLDIEGTRLPTGAYTLYIIPDKDNWVLVVNKNVTKPEKYDKQHDVVRVRMQAAEVPSPVPELQVAFGRMAPRECSLRLYYGSTGVFGAQWKEQ